MNRENTPDNPIPRAQAPPPQIRNRDRPVYQRPANLRGRNLFDEQILAPATPEKTMEGGGRVKKGGMFLLKKNDVIIPAKRVKEVDQALKMAGMEPLKK